jgi:uncharacterized membrane protein YfcA
MMTFADFAAATLAVALGSVLQAISGVGAGFLIVPMLAFVDIGLVPGPMIFGSLLLSGLMAYRERGAIDTSHLRIIIGGLLPGCIAGAYVLSIVPVDRLGIVFGAVILLAIVITTSGARVPLNNATAFTAATISGAMGASTGIGAPMLALLYQNQTGPTVRSTLAVLYTIASLIIVAALIGFGRFKSTEAVAGFMLMPGYLLGYLAANRFKFNLDGRGARIGVLVVSGIAAIALLLRGLV